MNFDLNGTRLEEILSRNFTLGHMHNSVSGADSLLLVAQTIAFSKLKNFNSLPHLIIVPRSEDAQRLLRCFEFLSPNLAVRVLPHFDVSPYSTLYPKKSILAERIRFFHSAQNAKAGNVFICPVGGLLQKSIPFSVLSSKVANWGVGSELPSQVSLFLTDLGYEQAPLVEEVGQFALRGGILDVFSPAHDQPARIELFGDEISSIRTFSVETQRTENQIDKLILLPPHEFAWDESLQDSMIERFLASTKNRPVLREEVEEIFRSLSRKQLFPGIDFLIPYFYQSLSSPLDHFNSELTVWRLNPSDITTHADLIYSELKQEFEAATGHAIRPEIKDLFLNLESLQFPDGCRGIEISPIEITDLSSDSVNVEKISYKTQNMSDFNRVTSGLLVGSEPWRVFVKKRLLDWLDENYRIFIFVKNQTQADRLNALMSSIEVPCVLLAEGSPTHDGFVSIFISAAPESFRSPEDLTVILRDDDFFGKKERLQSQKRLTASEEFQKKARSLSFGDLNPGDYIVHVLHGLGKYEGLSVMNIGGANSEFIQISYKDKDRLYLPVYRLNQIQRYSGLAENIPLDKLGGTGWEKTKSKVKGAVKDLANDLLKIYAQRAQVVRPAFNLEIPDFLSFESQFVFEETTDQLRAIEEISSDLSSNKPMDRLICGDVGFGKTEVAMRAAFIAAKNKKQVAVLAPTTVLAFQHVETFRRRFKGFDIRIEGINRFVSDSDARKILSDLKAGSIDIIIGTHRLLSKDVQFNRLGLLIVDEEQKFGVAHKEKIKKTSINVDTLALSATPIPRTLNMSLMGIRDLSLINTAPVDRIPTRTFIIKWDAETVAKAIRSEVARGGQVYLIHNRVQSIYALAAEVRALLPEVRFDVAHGQMEEDSLEKTMIRFFNHEIDVLICTSIVESGMDVSRANTMIIDQAHIMGLSQLYQLRGRVGRSKQRAYCYLILPKSKQLEKTAQERLKVIQENSALGSGIRIAQYDLELRGAGEILGDNQSGHINSVGYELYMDLLKEAVSEAQGLDVKSRTNLEPEINLRIPALIPDKYIEDVRIRLSYYKQLSDAEDQSEIDSIAEEMQDQFGALPEELVNLMGFMLIRSVCKKIGVRDVSAGLKNLIIMFTEQTPLTPEIVIKLSMRENKKYSISPDGKMTIRMNAVTWPAALEELNYLLSLV
jgi:transcription-repair coupling factor (superfamily II helicase)